MNAPALTPPRPSPQPGLRRTARLGRGLVFVGGAVFLVNALAAWLSPHYAVHIAASQTDVRVLGPLTPATRLVFVAWDIPSLAVILAALHQVWQLLGEYLQSRVFSARALASLRGFARWVLVGAFLAPVYRAGLSVILSWQNGPGKRLLSVNLSSDDFLLLLLGVVVLAIASVMAEAARIAEDNEGFV